MEVKEFNDLIELVTGENPNFDNNKLNEFHRYLNEKESSMSVNQITHQDVTDCIKLLVEIGNVFYVDSDEYYIRVKSNDKLVKLEDKEKETPIKIYHNNRLPGDYFVLNLFKETSVPNEAQKWYFERVDETLSMFMLLICYGLIDVFSGENPNEEKGRDILSIISFNEKVKPTVSMKDDLKKIALSDIFNIYYDKASKSAELQSSLNEPEVKKKYKGIKAKTWEYIDAVFEAAFICKPGEIHERYEYKTTTIGAPHCEAIITLAYRFYKDISELLSKLGINSIDLDAYAEHLRYIEKYQKMVLWDDGVRSKPLKEVSVPWNTKTDQPTTINTVSPQQYPWGAPKSSVPNIVVTPQGMRVNDGSGLPNNTPSNMPNYGGVPSYGVPSYGGTPNNGLPYGLRFN